MERYPGSRADVQPCSDALKEANNWSIDIPAPEDPRQKEDALKLSCIRTVEA